MAKRHLIGTITSVKMHETALVRVERTKEHRLYGKRYRQSTTLAAHNPSNEFALGDVVEIEEHRPISKTKHWMIRHRLTSNAPAALVVDEAAVQEVLGENTQEIQDKSE